MVFVPCGNGWCKVRDSTYTFHNCLTENLEANHSIHSRSTCAEEPAKHNMEPASILADSEDIELGVLNQSQLTNEENEGEKNTDEEERGNSVKKDNMSIVGRYCLAISFAFGGLYWPMAVGISASQNPGQRNEIFSSLLILFILLASPLFLAGTVMLEGLSHRKPGFWAILLVALWFYACELCMLILGAGFQRKYNFL